MKIALFGGSFNPIHNGHIKIAEELLKRKLVEEVWLIPCGNHAFNKELASAEFRLNLIKVVIASNPQIKVVDIELNNKKSYTSETIASLKKRFSHDFYFIIGEDNLHSLDKWNNFEYLKNNVNFILVSRPGYSENNDKIKIYAKLELHLPYSSTEIRTNLKNEKSIKGLVPEKIEEILYGESSYK